eukprot:4061199-Pyramimonas_sp.AAC.1
MIYRGLWGVTRLPLPERFPKRPPTAAQRPPRRPTRGPRRLRDGRRAFQESPRQERSQIASDGP